MDNRNGNTASKEKFIDANSDASVKFEKLLTHPKPGDEVVISGLSGTYPDSEDVHQLRDNLFNKIDMISSDNRRWDPGHPEIPQGTGKVANIEKFDAGYFGVHHRQAGCMDPMVRLILEKAIEALFDAGINPSDLQDTNTGVFIGSNVSETEPTLVYDYIIPQGHAITGCTRSMQARRISYFLKLRGPSFVCDTACSSSLFAFEHAYRAIRTGQCDRAIVGGSNLCLHPNMSLQFARLGILSLDGRCHVYDNAGNGYARSEAITAVILQKSQEAKRNYATVVHVKRNFDGYKDLGITYPSSDMQSQLYKDFYEACDFLKPSELSFLEGHGTGTKVGDPEELHAIEEVFLKGRVTPLLIGSVKSNLGHSEPASGLCSVAKAIIAMETGYIPPNLHYNTPRDDVKSLMNGRLKVVTEKTALNDKKGLIGICNYGFGGANCHVLLKQNPKTKVNDGRSKDADNMPTLVCVSGRTEEAVNILLEDVMKNNVDPEHIRLLQEVFRKNVEGHPYRGFSVVAKSGEILRSCKFINEQMKSLVLCFGMIDEKILKEFKPILKVPVAVKTIERIHAVLCSKGLDIADIVSNGQNATILETILAKFTIQMIFADILKALDVIPDRIIGLAKGQSLGALVCAYFDDAINLQEVVECAYTIALAACSSTGIKENGYSQELDDLAAKSSNVATLMHQALQKIMGEPHRRSKKIVLHSTPSEISSADLTHCFGNNNVSSNARTISLKTNLVVFEVGNGYKDAFLTKELNHQDNTFFVSNKQGLIGLLRGCGRMYELGYNPQIHKLFSPVKFPVTRSTPMISPKIRWNHDRNWWVMRGTLANTMNVDETNGGITVRNNMFTSIQGHVIHAFGYLQLSWETLFSAHRTMLDDTTVVFENCKFKTACSVLKSGTKPKKLMVAVKLKKESGEFEVLQDDESVVSGKITESNNESALFTDISFAANVTQSMPMKVDDIYKELRLRGYNYKSQFRGIKSCSTKARIGDIVWDGVWPAFVDNMIQLRILQEDTRLLYIPTSIQRLTIDSRRHLDYVKSFGQDNPKLPVYISKEAGIIRSGFIEIRGIKFTSISKKECLDKPVLEKYIFVPNVFKLKIDQAIKVNMQILTENLCSVKIQIVELIDGTASELSPMGGLIQTILADQPVTQPTIISRKIGQEVKNGQINDREMSRDVDMVVASGILQKKDVLNHLTFSILKENGFVLSRESLDFDATSYRNSEITIITAFTTEKENLIFFRRNNYWESKTPVLVRITSDDKQFTWLPRLKNALKQDDSVLIYAQGETMNGALGLFTCLRKEPGGENVKLVFLDSDTPPFDLKLPFYQNQFGKNLAVNVFKNGHWGTYRYLLLEQGDQIKAEHCYLNTMIRGDLSTLTWVEGPLGNTSPMQTQETLVSVYYASVNFKDVLTASGRISADIITSDRREQHCVQGLEFSGRTQKGKRVMGILEHGACASLVKADKYLLWDVPNHWSLTDAATVPVAYAICMYSFFIRGKMKQGNTVLIHSGAGGVGQAAITLALQHSCTVYTTVGTHEKRQFLKEKFPQLTDMNIANSRDTSFENHIYKVTNGRGVDIVLNSLTEDKLLASVRCLARGGTFLEIGKFDIANDSKLCLLFFEKEASFHGITLDFLFHGNLLLKSELVNMMQEGINKGTVQPLQKTEFNMDQPEKVFRYMSSGLHKGKILLQIRKEEKEMGIKPAKLKFPAVPRYYCDENKTYIICGGLGGFGLELADWLVLRGCKKLVLTSRSGIRTGYQAYRISIWRSYGCFVKLFTGDFTTKEGCQNLVNGANILGPVHAIFNLAIILKDSLLENQTEENFKISFGPKAYATEYLDCVSRESCPELRDFVVFSSVTSGRGLAGQANYGMSNSIMERICEKRRNEGFPALTIQWGAIGDVGVVADLQDETFQVEGTNQQRISSCLQCMDILLRQNESAVVSSIVVAAKNMEIREACNLVDDISKNLGIKDLKTISLPATLAEIGMDSIVATEVKQTFERKYGIFLSPEAIRNMTFAKLIEIQEEKSAINLN